MARNYSTSGGRAYVTSEDDALAKLPPVLRDRLFYGPFNWSAAWTLNEYKRQLKTWPPTLAAKRVIERLDEADEDTFRKRTKGAPVSTFVACNVSPLRG